MKKLGFAFLFIALAALLAATPVSVSWTEGAVDRKVGSAWKAIQPGDAIESADTIRLGSGAFAEFKAGARKLVLSAPGTYVLDTLLQAGADASKRNAVIDKLAKAVAPTTASTAGTTVGGVRAAEAPSTTVTWADESEDARALVKEAQADVAAALYQAAADKYAEAADGLDGGERAGALYGRAFCLAALGDTIPALKQLRAMPVEGEWSGPRALLLARLDLDTGAAVEARTILEKAITDKAFIGDDLDAAKAMLAEAIAYK